MPKNEIFAETVEVVAVSEVSGLYPDDPSDCMICGEPATFQRIYCYGGEPEYGEPRCAEHKDQERPFDDADDPTAFQK